MCYLQVNVLFDFLDEAALKNSSRMGKAVSDLVYEYGWQVSDDSVANPQHAWEVALRRGQRSAWLAFVNPSGFEITLSIVTRDWRRVYMTANRGKMQQAEHVAAFVGACEGVYQALGADYGFGLVAMDTEIIAPPSTGDYSVSKLYDFNFYSPRLVRKIGLSALQAAPSAQTKTFSDGGMLLALSDSPLTEQKRQAEVYMAASAVLGIPAYQQGC